MKTFAEVFDPELQEKVKNKIFGEAAPLALLPLNLVSAWALAEGTGFTPGANDVETWRAMEASPAKYLKNFLKKCLEQYALVYTERYLNGLPKDECIALFFALFDVTPKGDASSDEDALTEAAPEAEPRAGAAPEAEAKPVPREVAPITLDEAQKIYDQTVKKDVSLLDPGFDMAVEIKIHEGMPLGVVDHIFFTFSAPDEVFPGLVMLVNPTTGKVAAAGRLEMAPLDDGTGNDAPHLVCDAENLDFDQFRSQGTFRVVLLPKHWGNTLAGGVPENSQGDVYYSDIQTRFAQIPEARHPLCIDFGTSNTTAGTYGIKGDTDRDIALVKFKDTSAEKMILNDMLPTMVYVKSCGMGDPVYLFGYDAKKKLEEDDYTPTASFFFEIKRWMNTLDEEVEIRDEQGHLAKVKKSDIIFAYLQYVLQTAEQQFKQRFRTLHFTAPVKQKEYFLRVMGRLFAGEGRTVLQAEDSLDEATAIIYHSALEYLKKDGRNELDMLILDCGGGTTDLANCKCEYTSRDNINYLAIRTSFESGDANFGGNNITFRLLEILKIKIAKTFLGEGAVAMESLIQLDENDILSRIDEAEREDDAGIRKALEEIYAHLDKTYAEMETYIPTRFAEVRQKNEKMHARRNFYYLWKMAETIKIEFFKSNLVRMEERDARLKLDDGKGHYYLWVRTSANAPLQKLETPLREVEITYKEIDRILYPDIYALLTVLLRVDGKENYTYGLSGQSCKISLFKNLLKEFIPGRRLRANGQHETDESESANLKKNCIKGSIEYMRDLAGGTLTPKIEQARVNHIYDVNFLEGTGSTSTPLLAHNSQGGIEVRLLERPKATSEILMEVRDRIGNRINDFSYSIDEGRQADKLEEIRDIIGRLTFLDADTLDQQIFEPLLNLRLEHEDAKFCLFVLPAKDAYGVNIGQVYVKKDGETGDLSFQMPFAAKFVPYENEVLHTYFDGNR